jgi:hypothetical protein
MDTGLIIGAIDIPDVLDLITRNFNEYMSKHHSHNLIEKFKRNNAIEIFKEQMKRKEIYLVESPNEIIATGEIVNLDSKELPK